jgi:hypothetical protein
MTSEEASVWVTGAATIVTAIATGVLAWVTWLLWKATNRMAAATSEPYVVATLEPNRWSFIHLDLVLENTGSGPAFDVQIVFTPPIARERGGVADVQPIDRVAVLRPAQVLRDYLSKGGDFLEKSYRVSLSWKTSPTAATRVTNAYDLDIKHYDKFIQLGGNDPAFQMAQELKKLREAIEPVMRGQRKTGVDVYSQADRDAEARELERIWAEQSARSNEPSAQRRAAPKKVRTRKAIRGPDG